MDILREHIAYNNCSITALILLLISISIILIALLIDLALIIHRKIKSRIQFSKLEYFYKCRENIHKLKYVEFSKDQFDHIENYLIEYNELINQFSLEIAKFKEILSIGKHSDLSSIDMVLNNITAQLINIENKRNESINSLKNIHDSIANILKNSNSQYSYDIDDFIDRYDKYMQYTSNSVAQLNENYDNCWEQIYVIRQRYRKISVYDIDETDNLYDKIYYIIVNVNNAIIDFNRDCEKILTEYPYAKIQLYGKKMKY